MWDPIWMNALPAPSSTVPEDPGYKIHPATIVDLLPRLDPVEQQIVDLVVFQGMRQHEAGELLGMRQTSVSYRLAHAYALRRHWATLTPYDPTEVGRLVLSQRRPWGGRPPNVDRWMEVLRAYSRGDSTKQIASQHGISIEGVYDIVRKLRRTVPSLRPHLTRPSWPSWVKRQARKTRH